MIYYNPALDIIGVKESNLIILLSVSNDSVFMVLTEEWQQIGEL